MLSPRNPFNSDSEAVNVPKPHWFEEEGYIAALLASGFRQKDDNEDVTTFSPCPLGTFIDPSTKGKEGCQKCPPGNFKVLLI